MKKIVLFLLMFFTLCFSTSFALGEDNPDDVETAKGVVLSVVNFVNNDPSLENYISKTQAVKVKILTGSFQNEVVNIKNELSHNKAFNMEVKAGSRVILQIENSPDGYNAYLADIDRSAALAVFLALFLVLFLVLTGKKAIVPLLFSFMALGAYMIALPKLVLSGTNPLFATTLIACALGCLFFVRRYKEPKKNIFAMFSTVLSLLFASIVSYCAVVFAPLSGFTTEEATILAQTLPNIDIQMLLACGMTVSSFGFVLIGQNYVFKNHLTSREEIADLAVKILHILSYIFFPSVMLLVFLATGIDILKFMNLNIVATVFISAMIVGISAFMSIFLALGCVTILNKCLK